MANRTVSVRLLADIGQYVGGMNTAAAATMRLGAAATANTDKAKAGFDVAGKGALIMGGAVAGGMALAASKSMDFEKSMSAVAAATNATAGTLADLRDAAMKAGADTQYSATEAADAITEMSKAGVAAKDIMGGGLTGALSLAAAGQIEVARAAEISSVAMTQFNLAGEDLPHVADLLAAGAGKAMGSVEDLGAALNQSGLIASAAGLSIEETTGTLAAFANAGLIGSDAGTSFKTMLQAIQAPSGKAAELMEELGINMYDANGNMLSASEMAGVLQGSLSGLTEEQRNSALATIFGTDAVRAANVLYKEGADGIAGWTAKVNDAGYAAETAAKLNDNLRGDLERLGGAFDTLLIQMGSGAQGPLRDFVQMLTGLVEIGGDVFAFLSSIPTPVYLLVGALTAARLLGGPVSSAFETIALKALYMKDAVAGASVSMTSLKTAGSGVVSALGGPWGIAIAAGTVLLGNFAARAAETKEEVDRWATAIRGGGQAAAELEAAVARQANAGFMEKVRQAFTFDDEHNIEENFQAAKQATEDYYRSLDPVAEAQARVAEWTSTLSYRVETLGAKHEDTTIAQERLGYWTEVLEGRQGRLQTATEEATGATEDAEGASSDFATQMEATQAAVDDAKKAVDGFKLSLDILSGDTVSMIEVESAFEQAIAEADGAMKDLTGTVEDGTGELNLQSEAGRKAADVLLGVRDSGNQLIATMIQQGASSAEVRAKDAQLRQSFIDTARQMGVSEQGALDLANQILGIPASRETKIDADVTAAQSAIDGLVNSNSGRVIELKVGSAAYMDFRRAEIQSGVRRAQGGPVYGPGTSTSDSIPALLSNGEFVVNARATSYHRELLEAINSGRLAQFAGGGIVTKVVADTSGAQRSIDSFAATIAREMSGGVAGGGATGSGWASLWNLVRAAIPAARINSTFRPGDPGYHGRGKAIDFGYGTGPGGAGSAGLAAINRFLHDRVGGNLAELIYTGVGDDRPDLKNGRPFNYGAATNAAHRNHVHAAVYDQGGPLYPGLTMAYNGTGRTEWVSREFSGGSGGGGGAGSPRVVIHDRRQVFAQVDANQLGRAMQESQRDLEFLHG